MAVQQRQLPQDLVDAIESGDATQEQLRQLIEIEAGWLGLTFDEAVERAHQNTLPKSYLGSNLHILVMAIEHEANAGTAAHQRPNLEPSNRVVTPRQRYPQEIAEALERGDVVIEVTHDQMIQIIESEADELGLTFDEAVERAHNNTLPKHALGSDLQFNILMLKL
jgi:predicted alternative tryptophan synthase beta-subunit